MIGSMMRMVMRGKFVTAVTILASRGSSRVEASNTWTYLYTIDVFSIHQ